MLHNVCYIQLVTVVLCDSYGGFSVLFSLWPLCRTIQSSSVQRIDLRICFTTEASNFPLRSVSS